MNLILAAGNPRWAAAVEAALKTVPFGEGQLLKVEHAIEAARQLRTHPFRIVLLEWIENPTGANAIEQVRFLELARLLVPGLIQLSSALDRIILVGCPHDQAGIPPLVTTTGRGETGGISTMVLQVHETLGFCGAPVKD